MVNVVRMSLPRVYGFVDLSGDERVTAATLIHEGKWMDATSVSDKVDPLFSRGCCYPNANKQNQQGKDRAFRHPFITEVVASAYAVNGCFHDDDLRYRLFNPIPIPVLALALSVVRLD